MVDPTTTTTTNSTTSSTRAHRHVGLPDVGLDPLLRKCHNRAHRRQEKEQNWVIKVLEDDRYDARERVCLFSLISSACTDRCTPKKTVFEHLLSGLPKKATAKKFLNALGKRYQVSNNAESRCLMKQLTNIRYDHVRGVRELIMKMVHIQIKLKSHQIDPNEKFIVKHALNSLPANFTQIKTAHITIGEKWAMNDLITKCVAEEEKLKKEKSDIALLSVHNKPIFGKGH
ncbi:hypothetical protein JHK87_024374 [Glycine soja]|uniref:Uncharacterized protein n=1 Tax=Glycine max TaxID=3847 RepID=A0A0R0I5M5_SOYBN|nr:hypothetical protein JHK87_024374 [Glycine soja]